MPNQPTPNINVVVSRLGDVLILEGPAEKPVFLFVSRFCIADYLNTGAPECGVRIEGLAAEALRTWYSARLPFTFVCESLRPFVVSFRLETGFTFAVAEELTASVRQRIAGANLVISGDSVIHQTTDATKADRDAFAQRHGNHPDADAISGCVLTMRRINEAVRARAKTDASAVSAAPGRP